MLHTTHCGGGEGSEHSAQGTKSASGAGTKASVSGVWEVMLPYPRARITQPAQSSSLIIQVCTSAVNIRYDYFFPQRDCGLLIAPMVFRFVLIKKNVRMINTGVHSTGLPMEYELSADDACSTDDKTDSVPILGTFKLHTTGVLLLPRETTGGMIFLKRLIEINAMFGGGIPFSSTASCSAQ